VTELRNEKERKKDQGPRTKERVATPKGRAKKGHMEVELQDFSASPHVQQMTPSWHKLYAAIRSVISGS
jgi:hypothetical protein